jgi:hypothetical protein
MATAATPDEDHPVEACLAELLDQLGIASAHFAAPGSAESARLRVRTLWGMASLTLR